VTAAPCRVLVLVHAVRESDEREVAHLLLHRLQEEGHRISSLVWDRGMIERGLDLASFGTVREIEAINRWRTPQWLAKARLAPVARLLRQTRVRSWWRRLGRPDHVLLLGPLREEMVHYLPPGRRPVGLLLGARPLEPAESPTATVAVADVVLAPSPDVAAPWRLDGVTVRTFADVLREVDSERPSASSPAAASAPLVVGIGPGDWRGAPDLFVRTAAELGRRPGREGVRFAWVGLDPEDDRSFPYRFDATRLALDDRLTWTEVPSEAIDLLRSADVVVLTSRSEFVLPVHPWVERLDPAAFLSALGSPVVAFATPAAEALAGPSAVTVPYPDTEALADAVEDAIARTTPSRLPRLLDDLLGALGAGATT